MEEIQGIMGLSYPAVNTYLPYEKVAYKASEGSRNAERVKKYRERRAAVAALKESCTEENLWKCIAAFQGYTFCTSSGLPFSYTLKVGRSGSFTRELFIDRMENSKSPAWSSIKIAFKKAMEGCGVIFSRSKELADGRGISYSICYALAV